MDKIQLSARMTAHEGKLDELIELGKQCIALVRENEPNSMQYEYFVNRDSGEVVVRETYVDSNAMLAHMGNVGPVLGQMLGVSTPMIEVYRNASAELKGALEGLPTSYHEFLASA